MQESYGEGLAERTAAVYNCSISSNSAVGHGGGMSISDSSDALLDSCAFTGNTAQQDGGAIRCEDADPAREAGTTQSERTA